MKMKQKIWGFPAHTHTGQKAVTVIAAFLAALLYMAFSSIQVHAAEGFNLYTDTPGIYVTAGDSVSFDLHLAGGNAAGKDVSLSVSSIPDGFGGYIKAGTMRFPGFTPAGKLLILSLLSR